MVIDGGGRKDWLARSIIPPQTFGSHRSRVYARSHRGMRGFVSIGGIWGEKYSDVIGYSRPPLLVMWFQPV